MFTRFRRVTFIDSFRAVCGPGMNRDAMLSLAALSI